MGPIFTCHLNVPAWTAEAMREGRHGYRPGLLVTLTEPGMSPEVVAEVTIFVDGSPGRDRWAARLFPADLRGIGAGIDEGYGRFRATVDTLSVGEVRVPRETPREALRVMVERLAATVPGPQLTAIEKVASLMLDVLNKAGTAYAQQFRPAR